MNIPNLRSPRDMVGGIVYFGRMVDKARLHAAGKLPADYVPNLGIGFDERCCRFLHIQYPEFVTRVNAGGTEEEILAWCFEHGCKPDDEQIMVWNAFMSKRGWNDDVTSRLKSRLEEFGFSHRADLQTMFDFIDADEGRM